MINDNKPLPVVIRGLLFNNTPSGLRGVTNIFNHSGVKPSNPSVNPRIPESYPSPNALQQYSWFMDQTIL